MNLQIPKELKEAFSQNSKAGEYFYSMPPSHQKEYIMVITDAKKSDTRKRRAKQVLKMILDWPYQKKHGYSSKPLTQKLNLTPNMKAVFVNVPKPVPKGLPVQFGEKLGDGMDYIHIFSTTTVELKTEFPGLAKKLKPNGILWVSWPKGTSKINSELNENVIREIGLSFGMVDVKVCAVDENWSGLKFVYGVKNRKIS